MITITVETDTLLLIAVTYMWIYSYVVLERSRTIDETGSVKWDLCLVLLLAWILCCLGVIKGVKSAGKVSLHSLIFHCITGIIFSDS